MKQTLGITSLLLLLPLVLAGCGSDEEGRQAVADAEAEAEATVDGVVHDIAAALDSAFTSGSRHFAICGDTYAPRGVILRSSLNFESTELGADEAVTAAAQALEADGWQVVRPENPAIVEGEKGVLVVRVEVGPALVAVKVSTECVETTDDVARETQDREVQDIVWKD